MKKQLVSLLNYLVTPAVQWLKRHQVHPNSVTFFGLLINVLAAVILVIGANMSEGQLAYLGWAGGIILFAGFFDMIDGRLARESNTVSDYGALYDSVLDRYSELVLFFGICYFLVGIGAFWGAIFAFFTLMGSMMVSYTRARAENLGVDCGIGLFQRLERIIILGVSALASGVFSAIGENHMITLFTVLLAIMAILSHETAFRRLMHSRKMLKQ